VNIVDFFNQISMLYGTIAEKCTTETCPKMTAGPQYEYLWSEGNQPKTCPAPVYIDYLMTWVQDELDDENTFPSQIGKPFPNNFPHIAQTVMKRLFRVYAHIYHEHFDLIGELKAVEHLNTSFKHFILFVQEFKLIEGSQMAPLQELIQQFTPNC
jgi:MOB kinase activator 1